MKIKIVTDNGCDLCQDIIDRYDIEVLPLIVNDGEEEYFTKEDLTVSQMFENMRAGKIYMTSQVSDMTYRNCFEKYAKENRELIYISLSSGVTGTYSGACRVRNEILEKYKNSKIHILDSFAATGGFGLMVQRIAKMAYENRDMDYIFKTFEKLKTNQEHIFSVTNLEFLVRGGRISKTSATIGGFLNIKPILEVEKKEGKLKVFDKVRGEKNLIKKIVQEMGKRSKNSFNIDQTIVIGYGDSVELAKDLGFAIMEKYGINENNIVYNRIGIVIGAHTGPDLLAVFFLNDLVEEYSLV